jgi:hypothetical protein
VTGHAQRYPPRRDCVCIEERAIDDGSRRIDMSADRTHETMIFGSQAIGKFTELAMNHFSYAT